MRYRSLLAVASIVVFTSMAVADDLPPNKANAAKLAGLAGFVNLHCEKIRTDKERLNQALLGMKVDPSDVERDALLLRARSYILAYQKDVSGSCARAEELFGSRGRIIPGVFVPRS